MADAYGRGAFRVARTALAAGADRLAVAILDETLTLRENGINDPIMILGHTPSEQSHLLVANDIIQKPYSLWKRSGPLPGSGTAWKDGQSPPENR